MIETIRQFKIKGSWFVFSGIALTFCVLAYMFFIQATIRNVVARREIELQSRSLRTKVLALEGDYFSKSSAISLAAAPGLGLAPLSKSSIFFVDRTTDHALSLRTDAPRE